MDAEYASLRNSPIQIRIVCGLLLGSITSGVNHLGSKIPSWLPQLIDNGFLWLLLLCLAALPPRRFKSCFGLAASFIYAVIISYDATDIANGVYFSTANLTGVPRAYFDFENLASDVIGYGVFGTVSAGFAALLASTRNRPGFLGIAATVAAPVFIGAASIQVIVSDLTHRDPHPRDGNLAAHIGTLAGAAMFRVWNLLRRFKPAAQKASFD